MREAIKKQIEVQGYSYQELANRSNCSKSLVAKLVKGESVKFEVVYNIVNLLLPDQKKKYMSLYCKEAKMPNQLKQALEYASINADRELLLDLVDKCKSHQNKEIKEWGNIYELMYHRLTFKMSSYEVLHRLKDININSSEVKALSYIIEMNHYYDDDNFKNVHELSRIFQKEIVNVEDGFIKDSYKIRHDQVMSYVTMNIDSNPKKARQIAKNAVNFKFDDSINAFFYNVIAISYYGENVTKLNHYAHETLSLYKRSNYCTSDELQEIESDFKKLSAIMMGTGLEEFITNDNNDTKGLFITGKIKKDINILLRSLCGCVRESDNFFKETVINELQMLQCDKNLIEAMQCIKN